MIVGVAIGATLKMAAPPPPVAVETEAEPEPEPEAEVKADTVITIPKGTVIIVAPVPAPPPPPPPPPLPPQSVPIIRTENVTSVTRNSAILAGFLDPKGRVTLWWEYGHGDNLGMKTPDISVNEFTPGRREKEVSGLTPGTVYAYRVSVRTPDGRVFQGGIRTFMTDP